MGRFILKLMVFLSLIAGMGNYLVYLSTGRLPFNDLWQNVKKTPMDIPSPATLDLPSLPTIPQLKGDNAARAYKWTDPQGRVHYSDQPPDGQNAQLINVDPEQNILQGNPSTPQIAQEPASKQTPPNAQPANAPLTTSPAMNSQAVQELLKQIKAAAESAQKRPLD